MMIWMMNKVQITQTKILMINYLQVNLHLRLKNNLGLKKKIFLFMHLFNNMVHKNGHLLHNIYLEELENNVEKDGIIISTLESIKIPGQMKKNGYFSCHINSKVINGLR